MIFTIFAMSRKKLTDRKGSEYPLLTRKTVWSVGISLLSWTFPQIREEGERVGGRVEGRREGEGWEEEEEEEEEVCGGVGKRSGKGTGKEEEEEEEEEREGWKCVGRWSVEEEEE